MVIDEDSEKLNVINRCIPDSSIEGPNRGPERTRMPLWNGMFRRWALPRTYSRSISL